MLAFRRVRRREGGWRTRDCLVNLLAKIRRLRKNANARGWGQRRSQKVSKSRGRRLSCKLTAHKYGYWLCGCRRRCEKKKPSKSTCQQLYNLTLVQTLPKTTEAGSAVRWYVCSNMVYCASVADLVLYDIN